MKKEERAKIDEYLKGIVLSLPDSPGCYQYLNEKGVIIYVGKAKNLKRRVSSYFNNPKQTYKTQFLVPKIRDIRYIVVDTEETHYFWRTSSSRNISHTIMCYSKTTRPTLRWPLPTNTYLGSSE